ncbi:T9SS type A sorting domain-containing protein, partial [bacterium]|nr:T9SS type A sorting domain-containing protein [bacterium]
LLQLVLTGYKNYPNPFNPSTTIKYELPEHSEVTLNIYDITGRNIKTLVQKSQPAGHYQAHWNGFDKSGRQVASGMYFARLQAGDNMRTIKMVYLR